MNKWAKKYELLLEEELNTQNMKFILEKRHSVVKQMRIDMLAYFKSEGIKLSDTRKIPTELFLKYIGKDLKYYERKMKQEAMLNKYRTVENK